MTENLLSKEITSFAEILDIVQGWTADFRQLDRERFKSDVFQVHTGSILITGGHFGCSVNQCGEQPAGMRCFALQEANSPEMLWYGHKVGPTSLLSFPTHGEINVLSQPGFGVAVFSIPETLLRNRIEQSLGIDPDDLLSDKEQIIPAPAEKLARFRALCRSIGCSAFAATAELPFSENINPEDHILELLLDILCHNQPQFAVTAKPKQRKISQLLQLLNSHAVENRRPHEIYELAGIPRRTAQHLFKQELGITPKAYLKAQRLYAAHQLLWQADPELSTVSDIANMGGFWHMGQFAKDYQKTFGELPSTTLRRSQVAQPGIHT